MITTYSKQKDSPNTPSAVRVVKDGQPLDIMVHPSRDLFCFTPKRWSTRFGYPPFSSRNGGFPSIQNIAMEFDPSWNIDLPNHIHELLGELTARGCVARVVNARAKEYVDFTIWLIDRGATRSPDKDRKSPPRVFYDYEREYIETEQNEILHDTEERSTGRLPGGLSRNSLNLAIHIMRRVETRSHRTGTVFTRIPALKF